MLEILNDWFVKQKINDVQKERLSYIFDFINNNYSYLTLEIKWNQPMLSFNRTFVIAFSCSKKHISFSPEKYTINKFIDKINENHYEYTPNTVRIKNDQNINLELIKEIIDFNIKTKKDIKTYFRQ